AQTFRIVFDVWSLFVAMIWTSGMSTGLPTQPPGRFGSKSLSRTGKHNSASASTAANGDLPLLHVGMLCSPTKYWCDGWATVMHRAGTVSTLRMDTMVRERENGCACLRSAAARILAAFRGSLATTSPGCGVNRIRVRVPQSLPYKAAELTVLVGMRPSDTARSKIASASLVDLTEISTVPVLDTDPSESTMPCKSAQRCSADARKYCAGMCLSCSTPSSRKDTLAWPRPKRTRWAVLVGFGSPTSTPSAASWCST